MQPVRQSIGIPELDPMLGGGLIPGTLTVIVGASGVGKTQLGLAWAHAGRHQEHRSGALLDFGSRGDSQNHQDYAQALWGWTLEKYPLARCDASTLFEENAPPASTLSFLGYEGKRVLRSQLDTDQWHAWQSQLNRQTPILSEFIYRHLVFGTRRFLVDGIEPLDNPEDSLQLDLLELVYHRMLRQEHDWLAREVLRQNYRSFETQVNARAYAHQHASAVVLVTTRENMLEQLIAKPFAEGDLSAGANTVILMGRILDGGRLKRGLYVAKHRGSYCDDSIRTFEITDRGLVLSPSA
ncbi:MAG: ATPase domain-containing protein [Pirellulales bacterium]